MAVVMKESNKNALSEWKVAKSLLLEHWDPLQVRSEPHANDEYNFYANAVVKFARENNVQGLRDYLTSVERDSMGIGADVTKNESVARLIIERLHSK